MMKFTLFNVFQRRFRWHIPRILNGEIGAFLSKEGAKSKSFLPINGKKNLTTSLKNDIGVTPITESQFDLLMNTETQMENGRAKIPCVPFYYLI
mmetsp:Transcript_36275/g.61337  ORF Transcript_36275/g.61337 Transcript_36275/m.61337 type:complete len:94 (-) Transcript_36275:220-501(-)